jgi:hypothetical protein
MRVCVCTYMKQTSVCVMYSCIHVHMCERVQCIHVICSCIHVWKTKVCALSIHAYHKNQDVCVVHSCMQMCCAYMKNSMWALCIHSWHMCHAACKRVHVSGAFWRAEPPGNWEKWCAAWMQHLHVHARVARQGCCWTQPSMLDLLQEFIVCTARQGCG